MTLVLNYLHITLIRARSMGHGANGMGHGANGMELGANGMELGVRSVVFNEATYFV